jgi:hypothetical protein
MLRRTRVRNGTTDLAVIPLRPRPGVRQRGGDDGAPCARTVGRGLHPISVAVILIALLLAVAGITSIWLSMEARAGHAIQIVNIRFDATTTTLHVQNVGEGALALDSVYLGATRFLITSSNCTVASQPAMQIDKGQTAAITVHQSYQQRIHIKVVCHDGTSVEGDWTP